MRPTQIFENETINRLESEVKKQGFNLHVDKYIIFWPHHFDAFEGSFPNGHKKEGSIRYKPGHIRVPMGKNLLAFTNDEFNLNLPPRGIITIDYAVTCTLPEITEEEYLSDGFENQKDLFFQMTKMKMRYYTDLTLKKPVSYYKISNFNESMDIDLMYELADHAGLDSKYW